MSGFTVPADLNGTYSYTGGFHNGSPVYMNANNKYLFDNSVTGSWTIKDTLSDGFAGILAERAGASTCPQGSYNSPDPDSGTLAEGAC